VSLPSAGISVVWGCDGARRQDKAK